MRIKQKLWVFTLKLRNTFFLSRKIHQLQHNNCSLMPLTDRESIDIITVAFNNEFLIEQQIRLIKKYVKDINVYYTVADNSDNPEKRRLIQAICEKEQVGYIGLPKTLVRHGSYSHGMALNWMYANHISYRKPTVFGFIDHDLFPIQSYSILESIAKQDFYGKTVLRDNGMWYLWAGFCFFRFEKTKKYPLNFVPFMDGATYLDTGGSNYKAMYSNYNLDKLATCKPTVEKSIRDGSNYHADIVHYIDECWLHAINGSNWAKVAPKDDILRKMLEKF